MRFRLVISLVSITLLTGCSQLLIDEDPENNLYSNFDVFWEEMDQRYSFFEYKGIDWDSVKALHRPRIDTFTRESELFNLFNDIIISLEDGHVDLYSPYGTATYNYQEGYPLNSSQHVINYLENLNGRRSVLASADIIDTNLGYIKISSFSGDEDDYDRIDDIMMGFSSKDGIVIDLRNNGGGRDINALRISQWFSDRRTVYRRFRFRNGPEHNDFTDWETSYTKKSSDPFLKPVILLTNRNCFSSAEGFILSMKVLPHVQLVGGVTGGGSGNPIDRELPNGWRFRLSTWIVSEPDGQINEGIGIFPDHEVNISEDDILEQRDSILEYAIDLLTN